MCTVQRIICAVTNTHHKREPTLAARFFVTAARFLRDTMPRNSPGDLNEARGIGGGCRVSFSNDTLISLGWEISRSGKSFRWVSPDGQTFWSSKAVEVFLDRPQDPPRDPNNQLAVETSSESESDPDYHPVTSDDAFSSPEKLSRSETPISPFEVHKRYEYIYMSLVVRS